MCSYPKILCEADCKDGSLINPIEKISRLPNVQVAAWVLLSAFSLADNDNLEHKAKLHLKNKTKQKTTVALPDKKPL